MKPAGRKSDRLLGETLFPEYNWAGSEDLKVTESMQRVDKYAKRKIGHSTINQADLPEGPLDEASALLWDLEGPEAVAEMTEAAKRNRALMDNKD